jgi:large subunit ribosomal protein L21
MYAIIEDSGTQIRVSPGEVLDIDLREGAEAGASISFDRVLLVGDPASDEPASIGTPYLDGAAVTAEVLDEIKGDKIDVIHFKRRKGYRRKKGHRQRYLRVRISDIKS